MTKIYAEPGTEGYIKFGRQRLAALTRLRQDLRLPTMNKYWYVDPSTRVDVKSSEFGDSIRVFGGGLWVWTFGDNKDIDPVTGAVTYRTNNVLDNWRKMSPTGVLSPMTPDLNYNAILNVQSLSGQFDYDLMSAYWSSYMSSSGVQNQLLHFNGHSGTSVSPTPADLSSAIVTELLSGGAITTANSKVFHGGEWVDPGIGVFSSASMVRSPDGEDAVLRATVTGALTDPAALTLHFVHKDGTANVCTIDLSGLSVWSATPFSFAEILTVGIFNGQAVVLIRILGYTYDGIADEFIRPFLYAVFEDGTVQTLLSYPDTDPTAVLSLSIFYISGGVTRTYLNGAPTDAMQLVFGVQRNDGTGADFYTWDGTTTSAVFTAVGFQSPFEIISIMGESQASFVDRGRTFNSTVSGEFNSNALRVGTSNELRMLLMTSIGALHTTSVYNIAGGSTSVFTQAGGLTAPRNTIFSCPHETDPCWIVLARWWDYSIDSFYLDNYSLYRVRPDGSYTTIVHTTTVPVPHGTLDGLPIISVQIASDGAHVLFSEYTGVTVNTLLRTTMYHPDGTSHEIFPAGTDFVGMANMLTYQFGGHAYWVLRHIGPLITATTRRTILYLVKDDGTKMVLEDTESDFGVGYATFGAAGLSSPSWALQGLAWPSTTN